MRNHFSSFVRLIVMVLALSAPVFAQSPSSKQDLTGIWDFARGGENPGSHWVYTTEPYPMQPWAARDFEYARRGDDEYPGRGRDELNPQLQCIPYSYPRVMMAAGRPFEIFHVPGRVIMMFERDSRTRQIWMNGEHPRGYPLSFMGHSVGTWDGDTLVVDTTRLRGNNWLDTAGHQLSDAMHIVERFRRVNQETLVIDFLFDDPKVYTKPFAGQRTWKLRPDYKMIEDILCDDPFNKGGQGGIR